MLHVKQVPADPQWLCPQPALPGLLPSLWPLLKELACFFSVQLNRKSSRARSLGPAFPVTPTIPRLHILKGMEPFAAAGAIEAVVASIAVTHHFKPGNTNLQQVDPERGIVPLTTPVEGPVHTDCTLKFLWF